MVKSKKEFLDYAREDGEFHADYEMSNKYSIFPFKDIDSGKFERSTAMVFTLKHLIKSDHTHTVIVAYKKDGYYAWCGDGYVSGKSITKAEATKIATAVSKTKAEQLEVIKLYKSSEDEPCRFWRDMKCSHVHMALTAIDADNSILDKLEEMYNGLKTVAKNRTPEDMLKKLCFKKHVLLQGDKGSGKTHLAESYAKKIGAKMFFLGGNKSTEASDFIGEYIPTTVEVKSKGQKTLFEEDSISHISMIWKDGPLAQAFRHAANGEKAIFVLDEMLRIDDRELSPLISALSPTPEGNFMLGTRRAVASKDGIADEEVLICPRENLWIIATTNIGSAYAVDKIDEALADRLRIVRMDTEESIMKKILKDTAIKKGYSGSCIKPMLLFFQLFEKRRSDGAFEKIVNQRHLIEAIDCSIDESDIQETLWETRHAWTSTDMDGQPRPEQESELHKILSKAYAK